MPSSGERAAGPSWGRRFNNQAAGRRVMQSVWPRPFSFLCAWLQDIGGRFAASSIPQPPLSLSPSSAAGPRAAALAIVPAFCAQCRAITRPQTGARQDRGPMTQRDFSLAEIKGCVRRDTSNDSAWQQAEQSRQYRYILVAPHLIAPDSATGSPAALSNRPVFLAGVLKSASDSQFQRRP